MKINKTILRIIGVFLIVYQFYFYYSKNNFSFVNKNEKDLYDYVYDFGYLIGFNIWLILGIIFIFFSKYKFNYKS
jgi:hypothetical protein